MSFVDQLREARASRASVLHEFWIQYRPGDSRFHLFCEGHEDGIFFTHFAEKYLPQGGRLSTYRCDGKRKVFDVFQNVVSRFPDIRSALFFVDKDVDDILGTAWPTDPRVFVTDVYSIENYVTTKPVVQRFFKNAVKFTGVSFDDAKIFDHFEQERKRFCRLMVPIMAWAIALRRAGERPNLNNLNLSELCGVTSECRVHAQIGKRVQHLTAAGGTAPKSYRQVSPVARELLRMAPDRVVRGKFTAWFVVEFWKKLSKQLEELAREANGKVTIRPALERPSLVASLTPYCDTPIALDRFLRAHIATAPIERARPEGLGVRLVRAMRMAGRRLLRGH